VGKAADLQQAVNLMTPHSSLVPASHSRVSRPSHTDSWTKGCSGLLSAVVAPSLLVSDRSFLVVHSIRCPSACSLAVGTSSRLFFVINGVGRSRRSAGALAEGKIIVFSPSQWCASVHRLFLSCPTCAPDPCLPPPYSKFDTSNTDTRSFARRELHYLIFCSSRSFTVRRLRPVYPTVHPDAHE
jgi:hypothetical protein